MELINWSPNQIDTVFSTRSLGSGEPASPAGTFAAGYTMDAWDRWRVVCLAILSMEDIEDIYLFGTMITGLLLIGLGIALAYRGNQTMVTAIQSPTKLPDMIEAVGKAVGTQTVAIQNLNHNMVVIFEKLSALQGISISETKLNRTDGMDRYARAVWRCKDCIWKDQTISILSTFGSLRQHRPWLRLLLRQHFPLKVTAGRRSRIPCPTFRDRRFHPQCDKQTLQDFAVLRFASSTQIQPIPANSGRCCNYIQSPQLSRKFEQLLASS
ncbi:uncharacterized protein LOC132897518 isoform X2 [Neoarius graeffei]|uniref:uncharacterized protein LOC132897518 isoform X2 n=1 Tax=Neoarius graeffei TaxID=443677 RepID=UPI00298CCE2C|nr:uncharacterized protein LOC132897518 isoform X2 [Neoarius graeffei]